MKLPNPFVDFEPTFTGPGSADAEMGSRKKFKGGAVGVSWSASGKVRWPDGKMIEGRIKTRIIVDEKGKAVGRETVFKPFAGQTDASENAIPTETVVLSKDDHVETYSTKVVEALQRGNRSASKDGEEAPDASWAAPSVKGRGERTAGRAAAATANARGGGGANMNTVPAMKPLEEASFPEMKSKVQDDTDGGAAGAFGGGGGWSGYYMWRGKRYEAPENTEAYNWFAVKHRTDDVDPLVPTVKYTEDIVDGETDDWEYFYIPQTFGDARVPLD